VTAISGKALAKAVERSGWKKLRVSGSHHIYGKAGEKVRLTIPIHGNKPLKRGLLKHLLKQAGLQESDVS
jgi:predicted RNA binding protein YcfA (HicA-like mRNA interferase family)